MAGKLDNTTAMYKYGTLPQDIRFELDDWVLVTPPEGTEGLDCIHGCNREDKHGVKISWCCALPKDVFCPGCGEQMPEAVQGLYQMANADFSMRIPTGWFGQEVQRAMRRKHREFEKKMFLSGIGYVKNGCKP